MPPAVTNTPNTSHGSEISFSSGCHEDQNGHSQWVGSSSLTNNSGSPGSFHLEVLPSTYDLCDHLELLFFETPGEGKVWGE